MTTNNYNPAQLFQVVTFAGVNYARPIDETSVKGTQFFKDEEVEVDSSEVVFLDGYAVISVDTSDNLSDENSEFYERITSCTIVTENSLIGSRPVRPNEA